MNGIVCMPFVYRSFVNHPFVYHSFVARDSVGDSMRNSVRNSVNHWATAKYPCSFTNSCDEILAMRTSKNFEELLYINIELFEP